MFNRHVFATIVVMLLAPYLSQGFGVVPSSRPLLHVSPSSATKCLLFRRNSAVSRSPLLQMAEEDDDEPMADEEETTSKQEAVTTKKNNKSLLQTIDEAGQKLKPMALEAKETASSLPENTTHRTRKSILYALKSSVLFSLFIVYRAYRGFFVILPAVFREVYSKLETAVESPFVEDDASGRRDVNPKTGKLRFRTSFTVSLLAGVVTISYVVGGAFRVLKEFFKTVTNTRSVPTSLEAAADEVMENEDKMLRMADKDEKVKDDDVNGGGSI